MITLLHFFNRVKMYHLTNLFLAFLVNVMHTMTNYTKNLHKQALSTKVCIVQYMNFEDDTRQYRLPVFVNKQYAHPCYCQDEYGYLTQLKCPRDVRNIVQENVWQWWVSFLENSNTTLYQFYIDIYNTSSFIFLFV